MAVITKEQLENAATDADALGDIVNGAADLNGDGLVPTRTGGNVKTASRAIEEISASGRFMAATWADLATITDKRPGVTAEVPPSDSGTHTDPVNAVAGVPNSGIYVWSADPVGWERISDFVAVELADIYDTESQDKAATPRGVETQVSDRLRAFYGSVNLYDPAKKRVDTVLNTGGSVSALAGWTTSGYIPVEEGETYTISAVTPMRAYARLSEGADDSPPPGTYQVIGSTSGNLTAPLTFTVPAGMRFLTFNTKTSSLSEAQNIMVNKGSEALPYQPHSDELREEANPLLSSVSSDVLTWVEGTNLYNPATMRFEGRYVNTSGALAEAAGWACVLFPVEEGETYSWFSNQTRRVGDSFLNAVGVVLSGTYSGTLAEAGQVKTRTAPAGAAYLAINIKSTSVAEPSQFAINRGATAQPYTPYTAPVLRVLEEAVLAEGEGTQTQPTRLVLNGSGISYIESSKSGVPIRNNFAAFPEYDFTAPPCRLNLLDAFYNGDLVRSGTDEIAPDHALDATIDANHGFSAGRVTSAGHGKTSADEGSRWVSGGVACVLLVVEDANTLLMARETSNAAPPTGAYTHVSGASSTGGFTVSAVTSVQTYPPHNEKRVRVFVDGSPVNAEEGAFSYSNNAIIAETANILARSELVSWWIANDGPGDGIAPEGEASYISSIAYHFDKDGQMVIPRTWDFVMASPVVDLMGLQIQRSLTFNEYVVPSAVPFTYDGETLDYAMGVDVGRTLAAPGTPNIDFGDTRLQASGEYAHRVICTGDDCVLAVGMLPVGDAAFDVRRARVSNKALQIRGDSGKVYFRLLDKGSFTAQPGENYSMVGYRIMTGRDIEGNWSYPVRAPDGTIWFFADWRNIVGRRRLALPADLIGRSFELVDSKNATIADGGVLAGELTVDIDADSSAAYICIRSSSA